MQSYDVTATSAAAPAVVWSLLIDARTWPRWSTVDALDLERSSGLDPEGHDPVGSVRAFRTGRVVTGERLIAIDEGRKLTYADAFNWVLRDYSAVVDLLPSPDGGTIIHWYGTFRARWKSGWLMQRVMRATMQQMADGLATYATALAAGEPAERRA
ncbi:polyketide cyclase/dehydrase/lipid transport protein [Nocardia tenerifensis]|uniref:Polyketide cyclase/dehydrase/lipid transport protein n=1 Tax=Nocardia tenerifensis TaxID=228006 RepID=A0A318KZE1_9NOCA|nr:SRPBCC family protein [Nocardia tenerifensis]PXX71224.1 polyketide cyclase/dehydrase/lipid transport protein [Nocardia tenerifensis]